MVCHHRQITKIISIERTQAARKTIIRITFLIQRYQLNTKRTKQYRQIKKKDAKTINVANGWKNEKHISPDEQKRANCALYYR